MFDVIPFICLVLCFLNVWVWMKSTCKDNIWKVGSVYNLNNVPLDVDPKCIFVVQIYYRVFFFPFQNESFNFKHFLFGAWGGAGGAVTSCLKLHEVFTKIIRSDSTSALSGFFFLFLIVQLDWSQNGKGYILSFWTCFWKHLFWFHTLFKALKGSTSSGKPFPSRSVAQPETSVNVQRKEAVALFLQTYCTNSTLCTLKARCFHNHTQCCSVFQMRFPPHFV